MQPARVLLISLISAIGIISRMVLHTPRWADKIWRPANRPASSNLKKLLLSRYIEQLENTAIDLPAKQLYIPVIVTITWAGLYLWPVALWRISLLWRMRVL